MKNKLIFGLILTCSITIFSINLNVNDIDASTSAVKVVTFEGKNDYEKLEISDNMIADDLTKNLEKNKPSTVKVVTFEGKNDYEKLEISNNYDILSEPAEKANSAPNQYWDLSKQGYYYSIITPANYVYTNYYFNPGPNRRIKVTIDELDTNNKDIDIKLYEVGSNKVVQTITINPHGSTTAIAFIDLEGSKMYYIEFDANNFYNVIGNGTITHY